MIYNKIDIYYAELKICAGSNITDVCVEACNMAFNSFGFVKFDFNGIEIWASSKSDWKDLVDYYYLIARQGQVL